VLDKHCDYSQFNFTWEPAPWESNFRHAFNSQWQKDSGTYLVPKTGFTETKYNTDNPVVRLPDPDRWDNMDNNFDYTWHHDPAEPPYIYQFGTQHQKTGGPLYTVEGAKDTKFIGDITSTVRAVAQGAVLIKHLNTEYPATIDIIKSTRFISNYLDTLKRILKKIDAEYVWVISDLCDYTDFDFSWHPALWQNRMLHVFPSNEQKFGDTFFIHVPSFLETAKDIKLLEWYAPLNFIQDISVERMQPTVVKYESDSVVDAVWAHEFVQPVVQFYRYQPVASVTISLWQERLRTVVALTKGSESVLIPRDAKNHIKTQVYDYEWIDKKHVPSSSVSQDVVFISNGEPMAEENWQNLLRICPRAKRSDGVDGRELAYKTAASLSTTDWFFAVFAKTEVLEDFTFEFQPDRLQEPKHYIFHSRNPLNGLEYGAMNINLYNVQLVLDTAPGLDFTLSKLHTVIPEVASISRFNTDPWITWRSAFREVLKLKLEVDEGAGLELRHRLRVWCERAEGDNAEYCLQGANDALEYYNSVSGDYEMLKLSFDWPWLQQFYLDKHGVQLW
jgi:hypothetical protein